MANINLLPSRSAGSDGASDVVDEVAHVGGDEIGRDNEAVGGGDVDREGDVADRDDVAIHDCDADRK